MSEQRGNKIIGIDAPAPRGKLLVGKKKKKKEGGFIRTNFEMSEHSYLRRCQDVQAGGDRAASALGRCLCLEEKNVPP